MKLGLIAMTVLLLASACGTSSPEVAAIANSSAQQAETTTTPSPEPTSEPETAEANQVEAELATTQQSPFCAAIDELVAFPSLFNESNYVDLQGTDRETARDAIDSYRTVAAVVPDDAPNIVAFFFSSASDTVEGALLNSPETLGQDMAFLSSAVLATSIDAGDVEDYVEDTCQQAGLSLRFGDPIVPRPHDELVSPTPDDLCPALEQFEQFMTATQVEGRWPTGDQLVRGQDALRSAVLSLRADTSPRVAAYLRTWTSLITSSEADAREPAILLSNLDGEATARFVRSACPDLPNPNGWLVEGGSSNGYTVSDTVEAFDSPGDSGDGVSGDEGLRSGAEYTSQGLRLNGGQLAAGDVVIDVGDATFDREHEFGTARDSDDIFVRIDMNFDRGHDFEPADLVLVAPDGTEFGADPDQAINLDQDTIRFRVDRDVNILIGWQLRVATDDGTATLDL